MDFQALNNDTGWEIVVDGNAYPVEGWRGVAIAIAFAPAFLAMGLVMMAGLLLSMLGMLVSVLIAMLAAPGVLLAKLLYER